MGLDGRDMASVQYQNANNSVRVTDEFMQAVVDDADWHLRAVTTGEVVRRCGPATSCARSPRPPGSAPIPACSSTRRSTTGTPPPTPAASTAPTRAASTCTSTTRRATSRLNLLKFLDSDDTAPAPPILRRRGLQARRRGRVHRPGDPRRPGRLPDRADRRERPRGSASSASATPTSAPCSWRSACPTTPTRAGPGPPPSPRS